MKQILSKYPIIRILLGTLALLTLFILACGDSATDAPTPAPTSTPAALPAATATATPRPTPTPTPAPMPVVSRLLVAMTPPGQQTSSPVKASRASAAPLKAMLGFLLKEDPERLDIHHPWLATEWTFDTTAWTFKLQEGVPFYRDGSLANIPLPQTTWSQPMRRGSLTTLKPSAVSSGNVGWGPAAISRL